MNRKVEIKERTVTKKYIRGDEGRNGIFTAFYPAPIRSNIFNTIDVCSDVLQICGTFFNLCQLLPPVYFTFAPPRPSSHIYYTVRPVRAISDSVSMMKI